jgi:adenine-specific DNA-methyltransferase
MAVQITVLRLFLSLVQEIRPTKSLKDNFGIEPLPNLDYKFVAADTLIPLNIDSLFFHAHRRIFEYISLQKIDFFRETSVKIKTEKRRIITDLEASLSAASGNDGIKALSEWNHSDTKPAPHFDSRWMFGVEKFDIIIGNPPYIGEDKHKFIFERYKKTGLGKQFYQGKMDLFYFFFHIGLDMLEEKGILGFITSNYYLTADGAVKLREDLFRRSEILELINLNEYKVFESAAGQHNVITLLRRTDQPADNAVKQTLTNRKGRADSDILQNILAKTDTETFYTEISRSQLFDGTKHYIRFSAGNAVDALLDKMAKAGGRLDTFFLTNQGVVPGALVFSSDHARKFPKIRAEKDAPIFIYPKGMLHELCRKNPAEPLDFVKPFFKNSDIHRYTTAMLSDKEILYADGKTELPPEILKYLKKFKPVLLHRRECQNGKIQWYELQWARFRNLFVKPKIVLPYRCSRATFAYNEIPFYAATDVYYITEKDNNTERLKMLLGILNSKLIHTWLYHRGKRKGKTLELFPTPLRQIPLILPDDRKPLIDLVNRRLRGDVKAEKEIDLLVYKLYGLTEEERRIIERSYE